MKGVGRVPDDLLVPLVEGVHRPPGERHLTLELADVARQSDVPPRHALWGAVVGGRAELRRLPQALVLRRVRGLAQDAVLHVGARETRHRAVPGSRRSTTSSLSAIHWPVNCTRSRRRAGSANSIRSGQRLPHQEPAHLPSR